MFMTTRYVIAPHERGLVFRDRSLVRVLEPGVHRIFSPLKRTVVEVFEREYQPGFFQRLVTLLSQAHHPIPGVFESFQRTVEIHHSRNREVFEGTSCHFGHRSCQSSASALGKHNAMSAESFRRADDGAKIMRIGQTIQCQQQGGFLECGAALDQIGQIKGLSSSGLQGDALVDRPSGHLGQPGPGHLFH